MPVSKTRALTFPVQGRSLAAGLRHERFRLVAFETRDPLDPTSPRREASLFDSPGLRARLFLFVRRSAATLNRPPAAYQLISGRPGPKYGGIANLMFSEIRQAILLIALRNLKRRGDLE